MAHDDDGFIKRAIGLSAGLHLLLVPLFLTTPLFFGTGDATNAGGLAIEDRVTVLALLHRPHPHRKQTIQVAHAAVDAPQVDPHPHRRIATPRLAPDAPVAGVRAEGSGPRVDPVKLAHADSGPSEPSAPPGTPRPEAEAAGAVVPTPAPTPSPVPTVAAVAVAMSQKAAAERGIDAAAGGWGQNFDAPMLTDDAALDDLKAKYHVKGITIKVDENGNAVRVILPPSVPADARDEIVARLSALRYVPAECNGLKCAGTMTVTL
jgi:hypothetical protein